MRHRKDHRKLGRNASHRRALLRNMVTALFEYERIETTVAKAKESRRLAERLITFGKQGDLAARRHVATYIMKPAIEAKLFSTIAPWYAERAGGYTRIIRIGHRLGDAAETCYLELVKTVEQKDQERQSRLAAAEAKETALKGDKAEKASKKKKAAAAEAPAEEKPGRRGKRKDEGGASPGPAKKRTRTGVKTG
ncbi:MAG: 50S ribosomal protein L17 [Candidatus Eisenbacteria bacterium]